MHEKRIYQIEIEKLISLERGRESKNEMESLGGGVLSLSWNKYMDCIGENICLTWKTY